MKEPKFTPGPWRMLPNPKDHDMPFQIAGGKSTTGHRGHVCNVFIHDDNRDSTEQANAHLIAAAPEMYEALERVAKLDLCDAEQTPEGDYHSRDCVGCLVQLALAKARGETGDRDESD